MHQGLGRGPHHCSSVALIYYPVCWYSYLWPCPASASVRHTQTHSGWRIHMSAHWLLAPYLNGHGDTCIVMYFAWALTPLSLHSHMLRRQQTLTCAVQMVNSLMLLFNVSPSHRQHRLLFSSISLCILIHILLQSQIPKRSGLYNSIAVIKSSLINITQYA